MVRRGGVPAGEGSAGPGPDHHPAARDHHPAAADHHRTAMHSKLHIHVLSYHHTDTTSLCCHKDFVYRWLSQRTHHRVGAPQSRSRLMHLLCMKNFSQSWSASIVFHPGQLTDTLWPIRACLGINQPIAIFRNIRVYIYRYILSKDRYTRFPPQKKLQTGKTTDPLLNSILF